jgi:catechol 2,3-dioxygenase-like lactoylglutathione lyase family enzyme
MARGLDHIVHAVRDLDRAGAFYQQLGFTVGARNRHPWGTHNRIVQFPGVFIELVTFAEPDKLGSDGFSVMFAAHNRDFAVRHEGLSMLILESKDPGEDARQFEAAGITASPVMHFEREGQRPDGSRVKVGFSLAFADARSAGDLRFATCRQHYPENFWNPAYQQHPNGVSGVAGVTMIAAEPMAHRQALLAFAAASTAKDTPDGYDIALPRGSISVTTPGAFAKAYAVPGVAPGSGLRLAAIRFTLSDVSSFQRRLESEGIVARRAGETLIVPPDKAFGATLLFSPAG